MFSTHAATGPFPGIETIHDIRGNRRWVLGVFQRGHSSPTFRNFAEAEYFQYEAEERTILPEELEAWQPIDSIGLKTDQIEKFSLYSPFSNNQ